MPIMKGKNDVGESMKGNDDAEKSMDGRPYHNVFDYEDWNNNNWNSRCIEIQVLAPGSTRIY